MIVQCDFDGTIIRNNMSVLIRENFAPDDWRKIEADYIGGKITVEESNRRQYSLITEPKNILQEFVRSHINLRDSFIKFVKYCAAKGHQFIIVSSGLDFYIEAVLNEIGISDIALYCGKTEFSQSGIIVTYYYHRGEIIDYGFKEKYLNWLRKSGGPIAYIGDGLSDLEPAHNADYTFATGQLAELLKEEKLSWSRFDDFDDIIQKLVTLKLQDH